MIDNSFEEFIESISLTKSQRDDAITKYEGVCKSLNKEFYDTDYSDNVKFLFGSYKKKTTISHNKKDVDVIFKIPKDKFEIYRSQQNGPANLLTKVKNILKDTYTTTEGIKNWTKVVLLDFQTFKVEVLPAFEQENGKFTIPNTATGEDWIIDFDPKKEINDFYISNNGNHKLTRKLIKLVKKWKLDKSGLEIKTYLIDQYVIDFLKNYSFINYPKLVFDFFTYLDSQVESTYIDSVVKQSKKAVDMYETKQFSSLCGEYKKIFGDTFPSNIREIANSRPRYIKAPNEEFIEDIFPVQIDNSIKIELKKSIRKKNGSFRNDILLSVFPSGWIEKKDGVVFNASLNKNIGIFETRWKVRNYGNEAERAEKLRGEILEDNNGKNSYIDYASFEGRHFLECYILLNNVCISREKVDIPIANTNYE